ncbi:hypothetical protein MAR_013727 [Mya arenaria]|uniref:Uncharacterized protein n=1 Tax=Mya arenaria TaxID=6604 RepID=A0ABY7G0N8_MYAAR|nr:hypothetical protein MAR_013727 [Mya arenaria]
MQLTIKNQQSQVEVQNILAENEWLRSMCNDEKITFSEEKKVFNTDMQQCVYSLLEHNVSTTMVSLVIVDALKLANIKASRLPRKNTRLDLVQKHIAVDFAEKKDTCLLSDETSKFERNMKGSMRWITLVNLGSYNCDKWQQNRVKTQWIQ